MQCICRQKIFPKINKGSNCKSEEISVVFKKPRTVEKQTLRQHKSAICLMQLPEKGQQRVQQKAAVDAGCLLLFTIQLILKSYR